MAAHDSSEGGSGLPLSAAPICRAKPLLGTYITIRVAGLPEAEAHRAIELGFAEIAEVHRLMSFHEPDSDVSRLNRLAARQPVAIAPMSLEVLRRAQEISSASAGVFDITAARLLVSWGLLPAPAAGPPPDPRASWRDIELLDAQHVRFRRPLWIDLGGIAKGYAVDRAIARMALAPQVQCCINAGGDLRVAGPHSESVLLRVAPRNGSVPVVQLQNGSLASSSGREAGRSVGAHRVGPHVHGVTGAATGTEQFVSVLAAECVTADALTKVALATGAACEPLLRQFGATAYLSGTRGDWLRLGIAA